MECHAHKVANFEFSQFHFIIAMSVRDAIASAAILTGARDDELGIEKARRVLGKGVDQEAINRVLRTRLELSKLPADAADLEQKTGQAALSCIIALHDALSLSDDSTLGARDASVLSRVVAIAFQWHVSPVLAAYDSAYMKVHPDATSTTAAQIGDHDKETAALARSTTALCSTAVALEHLLRLRSEVSSAILRIDLPDALRVLLRAAFLVRMESARALVDTMLMSIPAQSAMSALRASMQKAPGPVRENTARLLSVQLTRPDGVRSLITGVLGSDGLDGDREDSLQRLESVAHVLTTPPKATTANAYVGRLVPSLLAITDTSSDAAQVARRAAVFTLVRLYEKYPSDVEAALKTLLFAPLESQGTPIRALSRTCAISLLAPPSPDWLATVVGPVVAPLLALDTFSVLRTGVHEERAAGTLDELADMVRETIHTWLRVGDRDACTSALSRAVSQSFSSPLEWALQGDIALIPRTKDEVERPSHISTKEDELVPSLARALHFPIDPTRLAATVAEAKRKDIGAALFFSALEGYGRQQVQQVSGLGDTPSSELERRCVIANKLCILPTAGFPPACCIRKRHRRR